MPKDANAKLKDAEKLKHAKKIKDAKKLYKAIKEEDQRCKDAKKLEDTKFNKKFKDAKKLKDAKKINNKDAKKLKPTKKPASGKPERFQEAIEWSDVKIKDGMIGKLVGLAWSKRDSQVIEAWEWSPLATDGLDELHFLV